MGEMTVEEAVANLTEFANAMDAFSTESMTAKSIHVVLAELKALMECDECRIRPGEWSQK